jgi:tetratricopeptide (TPR) repeat protein
MRGFVFSLVLLLGLAGWAMGQQQPSSPPDAPQEPTQNQAPPRSDSNESSSRDTRIDVTPPKDDAKNHPNSGSALAPPEAQPDAQPASDVQELHPWNPYKAGKDVEVGDFYFKRKSYQAALERYKDALIWKDNYAIAEFRLAQCYEKLGQPDEAVPHFKAYLKILPDGPLSKDARKALEKLGSPEKKSVATKSE